MSYQAVLMAGNRASQATVILSALPYVQQSIKDHLIRSPDDTQGQGTLLNVAYEWTSVSGDITAAYTLDNENQPTQSSGNASIAKLQLHKISLKLIYDNQQRSFHYTELTWLL